jgi:hypothetical protein
VALKILGQVSPNATTATTAYTVPSASSAVISSIVVTNLNSSNATIRIAVRPAGAALEAKHYIAYDNTVFASTTESFVIGITMAATDVLTVYASVANVTFNVFGSEI